MPGKNQGQNPFGKSNTTWATMRASTAQSDSQPATVSPQAPQWKPRGVHVSPPAPKLESFPALGATNISTPTASCTRDAPSRSSTAAAAGAQEHEGQGNMAPCSSNTQQQPVGQSALPRRRSLSAPALAAAAEPALLRPFSAVAGSSSSSRRRRSSSVGRGKGHSSHPTPQAEPQQHHAGHKGPQQTPKLQQQAALAPHHKQLQAAHQQHQQHQTHQQQVDQQQLHTTSLQLLQECHPWCDAVLLHEVLQAFEGDVAAALEALEHMLPAGTDSTANLPPSSSNSGSSDSDSSTNEKVLGSPSAGAAVMGSSRGREGRASVPPLAAAQVVQPDKALPAASHQQLWPAGPEDEAPDGQPAQQMSQQQQQQAPQQVVCRAGQPVSHQAEQQAAGVPEDAYRDLRGDAVRLSHKYRKASRKAAAARARGDFSAAAQLAADAVALKQAADAAHAAAAIKIEVTNNMHRPDGLWELDLHGLHVAEALQALHARVELLQDVAQDLKQQASASANTLAAQAADRQRPQSRQATEQAVPSGAGCSRKQAVLTSLLLPDDQVLSWEQQLAALRQELRVIVGKGLHSSGGEASLPRAVEQWLLQRRYKYIWRGGCIDVQLKLL